MALRKLVERLTKPVEEIDREKLEGMRTRAGAQRLDAAVPRERILAAGEIKAVRIVPRAGADALEVVVTDGSGSITGVFLGRRKIAGLSPGRKIVMEGMVARDGRRNLLFNPIYELR